jgi:hypothetical protein
MECTVFQRLKLLRRLQEVDLGSPQEALALLERVTTRTSSADDRERFAQRIRVTTAVTGHLQAAPDGQTPPVSPRLSPPRNVKRRRQLAKAARRRHWR